MSSWIMLDFRCPACGHTFEMLLSRDEQEIVVCPSCSQPAERLVTGLKSKHGSWAEWKIGLGDES